MFLQTSPVEIEEFRDAIRFRQFINGAALRMFFPKLQIYPVILRILGFNLAPHLVGKYHHTWPPKSLPQYLRVDISKVIFLQKSTDP